MLVEPEPAIKITKACCVLHNFVRRRDGFNTEDTQSSMESITERRGMGNSPTNAKDVKEYFVQYVNDTNHALDWQTNVICQ
ncbi:unnamed protein product [Macrosiphum euphorbiae]|uniref:Nuclease HARBI1 n=1 Tax=Macrosiphum euphorbiae TaxID=13131 RepID=A0AAV0WP26_9HEMI|nr:unnamed protein product [Macrosiphum euphorbiae]